MALADERDELLRLARARWNGRWHDQVDISGVVQQTLLEAHLAASAFRGDDEARLAWLRGLLERNMIDAVRRLRAAKRDARRERRLDTALLERSIDEAQSSPSHRACSKEEAERLREAVTRLPEEQRQAVELHHLNGRTLAETAADLGKSKPAVAGLLRRGLKQLRCFLGEVEENCSS